MKLFSILGICIVAGVFAILSSKQKGEYGLFVVAVAGIVISFSLISSMLPPLFELRDLISEAGVSTAYFLLAFKTLGICLITGFVADICRDFGQTALASFAESAGKCAIFLLSVPLLRDLLGAAYSFIG